MAKRSICTIKKADIDELGFSKLSNGPLASNQGGPLGLMRTAAIA